MMRNNIQLKETVIIKITTTNSVITFISYNIQNLDAIEK